MRDGQADRTSKWQPQPASPEELQAIAAITATGRAIHRQDQFVWHASDAFTTALDGRSVPRVSYAVTERDGLVRVSFLGEDHGHWRVLGDVDMSHSAPVAVLVNGQPQPDNSRGAALARRYLQPDNGYPPAYH